MMGKESIVNPDVLKWAIDESQIDINALLDRFPATLDWLSGRKKPTFKQLESLSTALHIPFGYFFLQIPPQKEVVVREFRTICNDLINRPSKNLEDTLYSMERISQWMRNYKIEEGYEKNNVVGLMKSNKRPNAELLANEARKILNITNTDIRGVNAPHDAFKLLRVQVEKIGIIVNVNGIVGNNTRRPLDVKEFRAFTLIDDYAPLIFINGKDSPTGRVFSLIHELFHIMLGTDGIVSGKQSEETLCNKATIEFFAPKEQLISVWLSKTSESIERIGEIAEDLKISKIALAIRLFELGLVEIQTLNTVKDETKKSILEYEKADGGNFWNNTLFKISPTFARALVAQTKNGITPYTEAFRLIGIGKMSTFDDFAERVYQ